jgi:hypothetical protein
MQKVIIRTGSYRGTLIENTEFDVVKPLQQGAKGLFITVDGTPHAGFPDKAIRVKVPTEDAVAFNIETQPKKSDEDIMDEMKQRFEILNDMTRAAVDGVVRGLIVTGPPGIGKSFGVEKIVEQAEVRKKIGGDVVKAKYGVEKGSASAIGLFMLLYQYSAPGSLLVLDDSDTILYDETSLNLLKAALDSGHKRKLAWRSESKALENAGVPNEYEFKGSIIFITNLDFQNTRGKIGAHLEAIMSRCHYLDMGITDSHHKFLRCKQIVRDGMLNSYNFSDDAKAEVLDFIRNNQKNLRELSLRMVKKVADLRAMDERRWKMYATSTCLRNQ